MKDENLIHPSAFILHPSVGRRSQVVRQRSAKPLFIGSIPIAASILNFIDTVFSVPTLLMNSFALSRMCGDSAPPIDSGVRFVWKCYYTTQFTALCFMARATQ